MLLMEKDAFLSQTRDAMAGFYDELTALPDIALSSLDPKTTALIVVDMVNGFAREGALASPRVDAMAGEIAALTEACRRKGFPVAAFADTHTADSLELVSYPPHCLRGTEEAQLVPELQTAAAMDAPGSFSLIEKNSTNGFLEPVFDLWRRENPGISAYLVVGDCTDICIHQFALTAKTYHNARNKPLRVLIPTALVDTFDSPGHPADTMNAAALLFLRAGGVELCRSIIR